ncbi:MAG: serine hydrolase [Chloroflexi bacterium]|nr:serine hydrolase [Chloroflexota bacterium]
MTAVLPLALIGLAGVMERSLAGGPVAGRASGTAAISEPAIVQQFVGSRSVRGAAGPGGPVAGLPPAIQDLVGHAAQSATGQTGAAPGALSTAASAWPAPRAPLLLVRPATPRSSPALQRLVESAAAGRTGHFGVVVQHLVTGESAALNADDTFRSASLYKLPVLLTVFHDLTTGHVKWSDELVLTKAIRDREPYAEWKVGTQATLGEAVEKMVTVSHNAATAMLIDWLGGEGRITYEMRRLDLQQTAIWSERAYTSPAEIAQILRWIASGEAVDRAASQAMLDLLMRQQVNDRLPKPLPPLVPVAHKTGELPKLRHDAGIVYLDSGPYLVVAMAENTPTTPAARGFIVDLSRRLHRYFEPQYRGMPPCRLVQ